MNKEVYATITCKACHGSWDITFTHTDYPPSEYAVAIEQKLGEACPDCGSKALELKPEENNVY